MDNIQDNTQDSPASEAGQEPVSDEQMPDTSTGETPENDVAGVGDNETPSEGESQENKEELIAGKFKTQEDLEKAYKELESHSKKVEMEKAEMDKFISEAYPTTGNEQKVQMPEETNVKKDPNDELRETLSPFLKEEFSNLLSPVVAQLETKEMVSKYGENFKANASKIAELKRHNPSLSLEQAYKLATYDTVDKVSEIKGAKKAQEVAEQKTKAQVETARPSGVKPTNIDDAINDPNVPIEDILEALGPEYQKAYGKIVK